MHQEHVKELGKLGYSAKEAFWVDFACLPFLPWNKTAPGPRLPADVVEKTALKYREALTILTGKDIG